MTKEISQLELLMEFFKLNPNRNIEHPEIVDWVVEEYKKRTGKIFRDPDRGIRSLHQKGYLIKVKKGIYRYDPDFVKIRELEDFTSVQKEEIFKRDGYKCVQCGRSRKEGFEIQADHVKAKDKGGKAVIDNGQTLCSICNFRKKNYNQTESGKKMFIYLLKTARKINDEKMIKFCEAILETFEDFDINGHIEWRR